MKHRHPLLAAVLSLCLAASVHAADRGTPDEAKALLVKAVTLLKANPQNPAKVAQQVMDKQGGFIDRDLYVSILDMDGKSIANGGNPRLVGKDNLNIQDADGKFLVKERLEIAKKAGHGVQEYRTMNPSTKEIETKLNHFEKVGAWVVSVGSFKP